MRRTSTPILELQRSHGAYVLDTDVSDDQAVCVVTQQQPDTTSKPVGYWSRPIMGAEKSYSTKDNECLAIVWDLFMLRPYVLEARFIVRTDHSAIL